MSDGSESVAITVNLPGADGPVAVSVAPGRPTLVLGANGTGKSALVNRLVSGFGDDCVYLPGSRPSYFDNDSINLTPQNRTQLTANFRAWDRNPTARYRSHSGTQRNDKAIYDLQAAEVQYKLDAAEKIAREGASSAAIALLQTRSSPIDRANRLLRQSNLPIQIAVEGAQLVAKRSGNSFSIAKMSDGERSSIVVIAEITAAQTGSTFVIDEPELHLHRSIVVPMLRSLIAERPDCAFVICTHELALADEIEDPQVVLVRGCQWAGETVSTWELDVLPNASAIPDDLRRDVLGSRRRILFVEGRSASLDRPLYALLFPGVSVQPKETCKDVRRAVEGLKGVEHLHNVTALGLVDRDGISLQEASKLEAVGVHPLPFYSVESLYYSRAVRQAVAVHQAATLKADPDDLMRLADAAALQVVTQDRIDAFSARIAERRVRDALLNALPDAAAIRSNPTIELSVPSCYADERSRLQGYVSAGDLDAIIERYPVRESGMLDAIAKGLRLIGRQDYEKAALVRVETEAAVAAAIRTQLASLAVALA